MRAAFYTLGCKVNQYETQNMMDNFLSHGVDIVGFSDLADIYVINSCTVTEQGDKKTKQLIRRIRRENKDAVIALTGCFPQAFPQDAEAIAEIDVVQGASNRGALFDNINEFMRTKKRIISIIPHTKEEKFEKMQVRSFSEHTRAFVKIEDGCDRYCSYCIIPKARGFIRSKPLEDLKAEITELSENGYAEVVLVGINLSSYGKEHAYRFRLADAVELACSVEKIERVRLGSLEPELLTYDDLKRLAKLDKFCPQFHLSLQSGCDETLKRMNRHYTSDEYYDIIKDIRTIFENPAITTDIMVGFAGETDEEFKASIKFLEKVGFARTHVFPYSVRAGTRAADMPNKVSAEIKACRAAAMSAAAERLQKEFLKTQTGKRCKVLFEQKTPSGEFTGYTKNYTKVIVQSSQDLTNQIRTVELLSVKDDCCVGTVI